MDDDDGLMLNFSAAKAAPVQKKQISTPVKPNKKVLQAKDTQTNKTTMPKNNNDPAAAAAAAATTTIHAAAGQSKMHGKQQVLSSIFTSNPTFHQPRFSKKKSGLGIPSNAPVADATTFTGLGIDPDLVDLLSNKFSIGAPTNVQRKAVPLLLGPSRTVRDATIPSNDVDVVVQAETGSGKTLTYLLPIVNRLVGASTFADGYTPFGDRAIGTVAIILTPTRELAQQVASVLEKLVNLPPRSNHDQKRLHWIVPGVVIGGDKKSKEKARLRKGVNVLVSTPGRLLDHLENTKSFDVRNLRWLVLDEADRLLDLGFEETLKKIMALIDQRTSKGASPQYKATLQSKYWPSARQTVLCSATLRQDVKEMAGWSLVNPAFVSGSREDESDKKANDAMEDVKFSTPNQLRQTYSVVPAKLRLVSLIAMLRSSFLDERSKPISGKVIVFFSCCDSVDFHYEVLSKVKQDESEEDEESEYETASESEGEGEDKDNDADSENEAERMQKALRKILGEAAGGSGSDDAKKKKKKKKVSSKPFETSSLLGNVPVFRLHGDLDQPTRSKSYTEFGKVASGVLLCTDVAARGLDLPNVDCIVQYDAPTDLKDYVHRVGRTARLGKAGRAALFLLPSEMEYLDILKAQELYPESVTVETVLKHLAPTGSSDFQTPAQEVQNKVERYVLRSDKTMLLARKAYKSSMRAYATHAAAEKHIFHVRKLHLGHMAKSFAMREAPSNLKDDAEMKKKRVKDAEYKERKQRSTDGVSRVNKVNPMKRNFNHANEFAIASATTISGGPTTRQRKKKKTH
ncbi:P-loop containing nucleoside triphosphate hydrolase protein [Syncephalastrum racemosum]|uniref:ATP-dependent RNA helicase n=1 Tax=Syncephalastrum racemosum TaxID=13706 RepID=A0A1X2HBX8_SYNRA|nr:P-loop containing nucleoside triphosphate hydrolase protein [Syncephalastrum racemosum]